MVITLLLTIGTLVYHFTERWSYIDSLYFSTISLTTRGFSDMHPSHWFSVLFTVLYLFMGVGIIIYSLSSLVAYYVKFHQKNIEKDFFDIIQKVKIKDSKKDRWDCNKAKNTGREHKKLYNVI